MSKKKIIIISVAAFLAVAIAVGVLVFSGNDERLVFNGGSEKTKPIEKALSAIMALDGDGYYGAFPPALEKHYEEVHMVESIYAGLTTISDVLDRNMLSVHKANYGEDFTLEVSVLSENQISVAELDDKPGDPNWDHYSYLRFVTEENTEEVWSIKLKLVYEGNDDSEEKEKEVYVVKQDGTWYLHPHFIFDSF